MHRFSPARRRLTATFGLILLTLFATGCAWNPWAEEVSAPAPEARPPDDVVESWRAIGKLAARIRDGGASWSAAFDWRQRREDFQLRLSGPFGQGALQIKGRPGGVEMTTAKGERRSATTPEALFEKMIGWDLPASSLRHWITARARPGVPASEWTVDDAGRLSTLTQQGWKVEYRYPDDPGGHALPDRVTLYGSRAIVRVVVRNWRLE